MGRGCRRTLVRFYYVLVDVVEEYNVTRKAPRRAASTGHDRAWGETSPRRDGDARVRPRPRRGREHERAPRMALRRGATATAGAGWAACHPAARTGAGSADHEMQLQMIDGIADWDTAYSAYSACE